MNFENLFETSLIQFLLVFTRASGMVLTAPIFQSKTIPMQVKVIIAFSLALVLGPVIEARTELILVNNAVFFITLIQELLVGLIIGFSVNLTIHAIQLAGYFMDVSLGFGVVNIIDPNTGTEMPLLGQFNYFIAIAIFLGINAHHTVIMSLAQSYELIKPGFFMIKNQAVAVFLKAFSGMFLLGFQIALPIIGAIFLADVALGIISKLIPQINVFVIGFPIKIILGLIMLIFFLPVYVIVLEKVFSHSGSTFRFLIYFLKQLHW